VALGDSVIEEIGDHAALLVQGGLYANFWACQSGGFLRTEKDME
jgi:ABC-type multidrug transport system fused ATPase/permease subunit